MKFEKKDAVFSPVIITLETQEEVDKLYAIGNNSSFADTMELKVLYDGLYKHRSPGYNKWHQRITEYRGVNA